MCTAKFGQSRIRKIRDTIPSVAGLFERLYKNPTDPELGKLIMCVEMIVHSLHLLANVVNSFKELLELEAKHGTPSHHTPAVDQLIEYYKKVHTKDTVYIQIIKLYTKCVDTII